MMPQCRGHLLTSDVGRNNKLARIIHTLMMNGAVLVPYPCYSRADLELMYCWLM